ncbi:MAG: hypothetical protein ACWGQW_20045 [bacterium]
MNLKTAAELLTSLHEDFAVMYSKYLDTWFVQSHIYTHDGAFLSADTEHRSTPNDAVIAFVEKLQKVGGDEVICVFAHVADERHRTFYSWDPEGFSFVKLEREDLPWTPSHEHSNS